MKEAYILFSRRGTMQESIKAVDIKSPAAALNLGRGLFVDENKLPLIWVNWSKPRKTTNKKTRPYFRHYPPRVSKGKKSNRLQDELSERTNLNESPLHKKAKEHIYEYLKEQLKKKSRLDWHYSDERISDFSLSGNFLSGVEDIRKEYSYRTPFGFEYKFDIALLGRRLKEQIILGVVELEKENSVGILKCLISRSLGFPMIVINIKDLTLSGITSEWCENAISETTVNSEDGLRRNYVYIHDLLYPVYLNIPSEFRKGPKHQYLIFCQDKNIRKLINILEKYKKHLGFYNEKEIRISTVRLNKEVESSVNQFENEGSIAGANWKDYNSNEYIRVSLIAPIEKSGNLYLFHIVMARLLSSYFDALVGYKYKTKISSDKPDELTWHRNQKKIIPKQLSEPIAPVLEYLSTSGVKR